MEQDWIVWPQRKMSGLQDLQISLTISSKDTFQLLTQAELLAREQPRVDPGFGQVSVTARDFLDWGLQASHAHLNCWNLGLTKGGK